jgi:hypothetical protein
MTRPPRRLKLAMVPDYIEGTRGTLVTKMTVYNWVNKGVRGEKLKVILGRTHPKATYKSVRLTTPEWVDDFLARIEGKLQP